MDKIVTHAGPKAHFDEFLAIGLLLAEKGSTDTPVFRKKKVSDPDVYAEDAAVVDIGGEHDSSRLNFDHHQSGENLPSSMRLVARHLGLDEAFDKVFEWYEFRDTLDCVGPGAAARAVGIEGDIRPTASPIEGYVLNTFAGREGRVPRPLVKLMEGFARSLIDRALSFEEMLDSF